MLYVFQSSQTGKENVLFVIVKEYLLVAWHVETWHFQKGAAQVQPMLAAYCFLSLTSAMFCCMVPHFLLLQEGSLMCRKISSVSLPTILFLLSYFIPCPWPSCWAQGRGLHLIQCYTVLSCMLDIMNTIQKVFLFRNTIPNENINYTLGQQLVMTVDVIPIVKYRDEIFHGLVDFCGFLSYQVSHLQINAHPLRPQNAWVGGGV